MIIEPAHWHPILVHFTFALLLLAPLFMLAGVAGKNHGWGVAAYITGRTLLWTGVLITIATVIAGFVAMYNVSVSEEVHHHIHDHRDWAIATASLYAILAIWSVVTWKKSTRPGWLFGLIMTAAFFVLAITGYKGGELVFYHGVAVKAVMQGQSESHSGAHSGHSH
jgi:uncharacterized membrane protein